MRRQVGWTHFHLYRWREVMETALGHDTIYLAARSGLRVTGVLPLVRVRSALFGHYLVSMPFVNYGGPLGEPGPSVRWPKRRPALRTPVGSSCSNCGVRR